MARWLFSQLGADRSRSGGDPAAHAFDHSVETFVREVIQNANDQALEDGAEVVFRFRDFQGKRLERFLEGLDWPTLREHLEAVADDEKGRAVADSLERLDDQGRLLVLTIEDRHTIGLPGEEVEDDSHFCALCRDKLFSHKQDVAAGGSYGLGKSVLWTFSGLATVLFLSNLADARDRSPRLIGRAELPYHALAGHERSFSGSGWFGKKVIDAVYDGERANSLWGAQAKGIGERLDLTHDDSSGTSIMVLGFRDPEVDDTPGAEEFGRRIARSAAENFWPALVRENRPLRVLVDSQRDEKVIDLDAVAYLRPFIECYRQRHSAGERLTEPGDVARVDIPLTVPPRRSGEPEVDATVSLLVRLAQPGEESGLRDHVAMFRGPGMVVKYWDQRRLSLGAQPFHAMLVCGEARDFDEDRTHDRAVEHFLRFAEPPGHDYWDSTPKLKDHYKQGYKKALDQMKSRVRQAIRKLVDPAPAEGRRGPDRLRRRFPIGAPSDVSSGRGKSPFHFRHVTGQFAMGRWDFEGCIEAASAKHGGWTATIELLRVREDGRTINDAPVQIESLEIQSDGATCEIRDGKGTISAEAGVSSVEFIGWSDRVSERFDTRLLSLGEIELRVTGELYPEGIQ